MVERRDVELLVRARNLSEKPLREVASAIDQISASLSKQVEAARKGEVSYQELADSFRQIQEAGKALASTQGQIDKLLKATGDTERLAARFNEAAAALQKFKAALDSGGTVTNKQETQLRRLQAAYDRANTALERNAAVIQVTRGALETAGVETNDLAAAQQRIVASATAAGQAATTLSAAMSGYARNAREAKEATRAAAQVEAAAAEARKARAAAITTFNDNLAKQQAAERAAAEQAARAAATEATAQERKAQAIARVNAALTDQRAASGAAATAAAASAAEAAAAAEEKKARAISRANAALAEQSGAQAQQTAEILARSRDTVTAAQQLATATGRISATTGSFGASLRAIADPAGEARRTLSGLEGEVSSLSAEVAKVNGPVRNYSETLLQLAAAQTAAIRSGNFIDQFRQQGAAVQQARAQFVAARDTVRSYQQQVQASTAPNAELARKLKDAENALAGSARRYREAADATRKTRDELRAAGIDTRNLVDAQVRLDAVVRQSTASVNRLGEAFTRYGSAGRGGNSFFGLSPYQIQNLGFQVNDFFTQIASGTSVTQAFSQQIGQVVQVFGPGAWGTIARWIPLLAAVTAAVIATTAALSRLAEAQRSTLNFQALLGVQGLGGASAAGLTAIVRDVEKLGVGFDEARTALVAFVNAGVRFDSLRDATELAVRFSQITGRDLPASTQLFVQALTQGRDGLTALLNANVELDPAIRRTITDLIDQGKQFEAQPILINALIRDFRRLAEEAMTPFQRASREAGNTIKGLLDDLGQTRTVQWFQEKIVGLVEWVGRLARGVRELRRELSPLEQVGTQRTALQTEAGQIAGRIATGGTVIDRVFGPGVEADRARLVEINRQLAELDARERTLRAEEATRGAAAAADQAAEAARRAAEDERRRLVAMQGQIVAAQQVVRLRELESTIDDKNASARARRAAVEERARLRIVDRIPGAAQSDEGRALIAREQAADMRDFERKLESERASAASAATAQIRRDWSAIQTDIQNTIRIRDEAVRGIQEDVAAGSLSPAEAIRKIQEEAERARPSLQRLRDEAQRFLDQGRGRDAVRDAAIQASIAQADRQLSGNAGSRAGTTQVLQQSQQEVQRLLQDRQQFAQTQDALAQQSVITQGDAQTAIQNYWRETSDVIRQAIDAYEAATRAANLHGAAATQAASQVRLMRAQIAYVDPDMARLRTSIEQGIGNTAVTAFNSAAEALGNFAAGVDDSADLFQNLQNAAIQFFADFLKSIAQAIIQMYAFAAAKRIAGLIAGSFGPAPTVPTPTGHTGGVVGGGMGVNRQRPAPSYWFANAPRYHGGGIAGLAPDEYPAILRKNEEVLTADSPRNILNGGGKSGDPGGVSIRNVLAVGDEEIAAAMSGAPGERVIIETLRRNSPLVKQIVR